MGFLKRAFNRVKKWFSQKEDSARNFVNRVDRTINRTVDRGYSSVRDGLKNAFREKIINPIEKQKAEFKEKWGDPFSSKSNSNTDPNYLKQQQLYKSQKQREKAAKEREAARKKLESTKAFRDAMRTPMKADAPLGQNPLKPLLDAHKAKMNETVNVGGKAVKREQLLKDRQALKSGVADKKAINRIKLANAIEHPNASYIANKAIEGIPGIKGLEKLSGDDGKAAAIARKNSTKAAKAAGLGAELGVNMLSFGAIEAPAKAVFKKLAPKTIKVSRAKVAEKLAKSSFVKNTAKKELLELGKEATDKEIKKLALKKGAYIADKLGADAAINATAGAVDDVSQAYAESDNKKDFAKNLAINAGLNWGLGGALTVGGDVVRGLKAGKHLKDIDSLGKLADHNISDEEVASLIKKSAKTAKKIDDVDTLKNLDDLKMVKNTDKSIKAEGKRVDNDSLKSELNAKIAPEDINKSRALNSSNFANSDKHIKNDFSGLIKNEDMQGTKNINENADLIRKIKSADDAPTAGMREYAQLDEGVPFETPLRNNPKAGIKPLKTQINGTRTENIDELIRREHRAIGEIKDVAEKARVQDEFNTKLRGHAEVVRAARKLDATEGNEVAEDFIRKHSPFSGYARNNANMVNEARSARPNKLNFDNNPDISTLTRDEFNRLPNERAVDVDLLSQEAKDANMQRIKDTRTGESYTSEAMATAQNMQRTAYRRELLDEVEAAGLANYNVKHAKVEYGAAVDRVIQDPVGTYHSLLSKWSDESYGYTVNDLGDATALVSHLNKLGMDEEAAKINTVRVDMMNKWGAFGALGKEMLKLTPEGRVYIVEKQLRKIANDGNIDFDSLAGRIPSYNEAIKTIANTTNEQELIDRTSALVRAGMKCNDFTASQTLRNIRIFMMLSNPKTDIKNILGNSANLVARMVKDDIQYVLEGAMLKAGLINERRTGFVLPHEIAKFMNSTKTYGSEIAKMCDADITRIIGEEVKYGDGVSASKDGLKALQYIKGTGDMKNGFQTIGRTVNAANELRGRVLTLEDKAFASFAYKKQFYGFLKTNGFETATDEQKKLLLSKAREYAADSAREATYREANSVADALNRAANSGYKDGAGLPKRIGANVITTLQPFIKTPLNVTRQVVNYTPVGVINGMARFAKAKSDYKKAYNQLIREYGYKAGEIIPKEAEQKIKRIATEQVAPQYISAASKFSLGMTGSSFFAVGFMMSGYDPDLADGLSIFTTGTDDENESKYFKALGLQDYSLVHKHGDKTSSTKLDMSLPMAASFFMGANVRREMNKDNPDGLNLFDGLESYTRSLGAMIEPVLSASCLSGISSMFNDLQNSKGQNPFVVAVSSLVKTHISQYIPAAMRATASATAPYDFDYQGEASSKGGQNWEFWANSILGGIPGINKLVVAPKIDPNGNVVGEVKSNKDRIRRVFNAFFNPFMTKDVNFDEVAKENVRLYRNQKALDVSMGVNPENSSAKNILPTNTLSKEINISRTPGKENAIRLKMNRFERAEYNRNRSQDGLEVLEKLLDSRWFNRQGAMKDPNVPELSDAEKASIKALSGVKSTNDAMKWLAKQPAYIHASDEEKFKMRKTVYRKFNKENSQKHLYVDVKGASNEDWAYSQLSKRNRELVDSGIVTKKQMADFIANTRNQKRYSSNNPDRNGEHYNRPYYKDMNAYLASRDDLTSEQKAALFDANNSNKKYHYGGGYGGGSGRRGRKSGRRYGRSGKYTRGGSNKKQKSPIKASKYKASKQRYKKATNINALSKKTSVKLDSVVPKQPLPKKTAKKGE